MVYLDELTLPESYKYIAVFPTMRCNLECGFCLNAFEDGFSRKAFREMPPENWISGLNRIKTRKGVPVTLGGGEPFVYKGFIDVLNGINPETEIDILTNLRWGEKGLDIFIQKVSPERLKRDSPYASIRVSYHPGQHGMEPKSMVKDVKKLQDAGFSIGVWSVLYPSPEQLQAIYEMQFMCMEAGIDFRLKPFTGKYRGEIYGDYSKFLGATEHSFPDMQDGIPFLPERDGRPSSGKVNNRETKLCECKTTEVIIGPNGDVYRCHRDLYAGELSVGNILDPNFKIESKFRPCSLFGLCHPCDVKAKTNNRQELGNTSVVMRNIRDNKDGIKITVEDLVL